MPKFMFLVKGDPEPGQLPSEEVLNAMAAYNEELNKAGVLLDLNGLHPSANAARVTWSGGKTTVTDGPSAESKELVAGYWVLEVSSREEVIEWVKKAPFRDGEVEIRQIAEADDFGDAMTPELRAQEERLRSTLEQRGT